MKLLTFRGGIHPPSYKEKTKDCRIKRIPIPDFLYIYLSQHTGTPSSPIIEKGVEVKIGQKIATLGGKLSSALHSPVNGVYEGIVTHPHPLGGRKEAMKIRVLKEKDKPFEVTLREDVTSLSKEELIEIIKESGIVGMGGAAFPTYYKLQIPPGNKIKDLIINGVECEPFLTSDYRVMMEYSEEVIKGIDILRRIIEPENVWVAIEDNKLDAFRRLEDAASKFPWIKFALLKTKYPQGSEKQLISAITKREVPEGGLPFSVGAYVQNVGTVFAIYEAVYLGKPLFERVVTVTGSIRHPSNFLTPIGTPLEHLIEVAEGPIGEIAKVINGGPLMGITQATLKTCVTKGTTGILVQSERELKKMEPTPCIRCGACVLVCPMRLLPTELYKYIEKEKWDRVEDLGVLSCMECGSCSYVCPAKIPLTQEIKIAKNKLIKKESK
ncbi:MAG: electron transport complex subunit RsxC [candidate division WOR-3 bacterium]